MGIQTGVVQGEGAIDLRILIARLLARRRLILVSLIVFSVAFAVAAFLIKPVFRASVLMIPASPDRNNMSRALASALGQFGGLASFAGLNIGNRDAATEEALAVLRSREFTVQFIRDEHLMPTLYASMWNMRAGKWKVRDSKVPSEFRAYKLFDTQIRSVTQDKETGLITLNVDWTDRHLAAKWANELIQRINAEMRSRATIMADASIGFLDKELAKTPTVDVRESINQLIESEIKQRMLADVNRDFAFRVIDKAEAPDVDHPIRPRKWLLLTLGPILGLIVGIMVALFLDFVATFKAAQ